MPDPRLTPEQDAELRRLLAEARHDEPIPDEVAQRLDRVLDGLRGEAVVPAPVPAADLAAARDRARRRRTTTQLILAAAVVVAVGIGLGHIVGETGSSDDSGGSSASVQRGGSGGRTASDGSGDAAAPSTEGGQGPALTGQQLLARLPVPLSTDQLPRDVRRAAALAAAASLTPGVGAVRQPVPGWTCASSYVPTGDGELVLPARYAGRPALLVLRPTDTGRQQAQVLSCSSLAVLRQLVVPGS